MVGVTLLIWGWAGGAGWGVGCSFCTTSWMAWGSLSSVPGAGIGRDGYELVGMLLILGFVGLLGLSFLIIA